MSKFCTIEDLRSPSTLSGYRFVRKNNAGGANGHGGGQPYYAEIRGGRADREKRLASGEPTGSEFTGPRRATPEEAAQDAADYRNGRGVAIPAILKTAGHKYTAPKVSVPSDIEAARGMVRDWEAQQRGDVPGYVYAITDGEFVKIGYSVNPNKRIAELQTGNARLLSLVGTIPGTESDERKLHAKYEHLNVLQEWFEIDTDLLAEFATQPAAMQQAA